MRTKERLARALRRLVKAYYWIKIRLELKSELRPCPICGSENRTSLTHAERFGFPIHFVSCAVCSLVMQERIPTRAFLDRFYARDYYRGLYWGSHTAPKGDFDRRKSLAVERAAELRAAVSLPSAPTILDYGAGVGTLKPALLTHWPFATVVEVDPGTLDSVLSENTEADLITVVHVLEHVYDPRETLVELKRHTKRGGVVYIEVPDLTVLIERDYHVAHVWYFSEETLAKLAKSVGFTVVKVRHNATLRAFSLLLSL